MADIALALLKRLLDPRVLIALAVAGLLWWGYVAVKGIGFAECEAILIPQITALKDRIDVGERLRAKADQEYRAKEAGWITALKEQQDAYDQQNAASAKALAKSMAVANRSIADNARLRVDIAAYAANGGRPAADDTVASASARAGALGVLLAEALRLDDETLLASAESADAAERNGSAVRALLSAWPQ
jgi:hypothetical protein